MSTKISLLDKLESLENDYLDANIMWKSLAIILFLLLLSLATLLSWKLENFPP
jgi:hypothetical protein